MIFLGMTFFTASPTHTEEQHIEKSIHPDTLEDEKIDYIKIASDIIEEHKPEEPPVENETLPEVLDEELLAAREINFGFVPYSFWEKQQETKLQISNSLKQWILSRFISKISVVLYEQKDDVRGKMRSKTVKLFGPHKMDSDELYGVFFHELAHYIDLYYFKRTRFHDTSNRFYDISWYSTIVMLPGQEQSGFVSGYAMSNKYEDFAESLAYYMLHNEDFRIKAEQNIVLKKKYDFFDDWLFRKGQFIGTDFSQDNEILDYYRDITKIDFLEKNFLQYLEKNI